MTCTRLPAQTRHPSTELRPSINTGLFVGLSGQVELSLQATFSMLGPKLA